MNFSVIVPCYNCVKTLENTVNSIRASGLSNYELLLIDDGSTDGTGALCDVLCEKYPELRCIHQPNAGVSAARNRGVDEARGDYLWFVDSDDTVDPGLLTHAVSVAAQQQPDMLIFGMSFDYYYRGKIYRREKLTPPCEGTLAIEQLKMQFQEFYSCNALTPVWNKLYRRDALVRSGVRFHEDMILMEDFLFVLELLPFCRSIYSLPEALYRYRQEDGWKNAYRRLKKISALPKYLLPFRAALDQAEIPQADAIMESLYKMLMEQRLHLASFQETQMLLKTHMAGCYASVPVGTNAMCVFLKNRWRRMRYRLGVRLKSMYTRQTDEVYQSDLFRYYEGNVSLRQWLLLPPELRYIKRFRSYQSAPNVFCKKWNAYCLMCLSKKTQIQIPGSTKIGPGFYIGHCGRIIINPDAVLGKNVNIATGVTIGQENRGKRKGCPTIGDRVWIGTNAVLVGNINIGSDVLIAPLSYVNFDVPDHSIVLGNPARIISRENATASYIEKLVT